MGMRDGVGGNKRRGGRRRGRRGMFVGGGLGLGGWLWLGRKV
jgi:hypothetical protein